MASEVSAENVEALFKLNPKQREFIFAPDKFIGFFGGIRNGKTIAGCLKCLLIADTMPGSVILVGRRTLKQLFDTTATELFTILKKRNGGTLNPGPYIENYYASNNGPNAQTIILKPQKAGAEPSKIRLRYAEDEQNFLGQEISAYYIDQAEDIPEKIYDHLESRLSYWNNARREEFKSKMGFYPKHFGFITGNPSPGWVKKRYKENPEGKYRLIEATSDENATNLGPQYVEELRATKPLDWVRRFIDGSWDVKGGAIYKEFNEAIHVLDYFQMPRHWPRFLALDHGFRHPTACYLMTVDEYGNIYIYGEHYVPEKIVSWHAEQIKSMCVGEPVPHSDNGNIIGYFDPSTQGTSGISGRSVMEEYRNHGIYGIPANNHVNAGINKVSEALHVDPTHKHPLTGILGAPRLYLVRGRCPNAIEEFKNYEWQPEPPGGDMRGQEKPRKTNDDAMDAIRYGVMAILEARSKFLPEKLTPEQEAIKVQRDNSIGIAKNAFVQEEE